MIESITLCLKSLVGLFQRLFKAIGRSIVNILVDTAQLAIDQYKNNPTTRTALLQILNKHVPVP